MNFIQNKEMSLQAKLNILSRTDSSVLLKQGETTVLTAVYAPVEVRTQKLLIDKASVEVCYRPKCGLPGIGDRLYENIIQSICEAALFAVLYPRSAILVVVQEMENFGGLISCAVNAMCLALLNSGIDIKFMVAGVTCALDNSGTLHVQPTKLILDKAVAQIVFVFDSVNSDIVSSHTTGSITLEQYQEAVDISRSASEEIFHFYKTIINKQIKT